MTTWLKRIGAGVLAVAGIIAALVTLQWLRRPRRGTRLADDAESLARRQGRDARDAEDKAHADELVAELEEEGRHEGSGMDRLWRRSRR